MEFTVSSSLLQKHIQTALPYRMTNRNLNPTLTSLLLECKDGWLYVMATNLEVTLRTRLPLESVVEEGAVILLPDNLISSVRKMDDIPLHFTCDEKYQVTIRYGLGTQEGSLSFRGYDPLDFAEMPLLDEDSMFRVALQASDFRDGLDKVLFCAGKEKREMIYHGVLMEMSPEHLRFVATDSNRIAVFTRKDLNFEDDNQVFIPLQGATLLFKLVEDLEELELSCDGRFLQCEGPDLHFVCQLTPVTFPEYRTLIEIDDTLDATMTLDCQLFAKCVELVSPFTSRSRNLVTLRLSADEVILNARNADSEEEAVQSLPMNYDGQEMEIYANAQYLKEALDMMHSPDVIMRFSMEQSDRRSTLKPVINRSADEEFIVVNMLLQPPSNYVWGDL